MDDAAVLRKFCITLFFAYFIQAVMARRPVIQFENVECERTSDITSHLNCSITKNRMHARGLSFSGKLNKPLTALRLDLTVSHLRHRKPDLVLANVTDFDGCQFLASQSQFSILQVVRKQFSKFSNMPNACPVKKGFEMHVKNFVLNPEHFPPYFPDSKLKVQVKIRNDLTDVASLMIAVAWMSS